MPHVTITVRKDGPYRVEVAEGAEIALVDHEGNPIPMPGPRFSLCRCGASEKKPFCDKTHTRIGFKAATEAAQRFDQQQQQQQQQQGAAQNTAQGDSLGTAPAQPDSGPPGAAGDDPAR